MLSVRIGRCYAVAMVHRFRGVEVSARHWLVDELSRPGKVREIDC